MATTSRRSDGGRQAAILLVAGGALTLLNNVLPGAGSLRLLPLTVIGVAALVLGAIGWVLPWARYPERLTLVNVPLALGLVAAASAFGDGSAYSHSVFFVVVFVWVGLSQPPGTSYWLVPPTVVAYVWPLLVKTDPGRNAVASVFVAVPVCVLVGEVLARVTRRQQEAAERDQVRAALRGRLVSAVAHINSELDHAAALSRICDGARDVVGCEATGFALISDGDAELVAVAGPVEGLLGERFPVAESMIREILESRAPFVLHELSAYPVLMDEVEAAVPGLHTLVAVPCLDGGQVVGALYGAFGEAHGPVQTAEVEALQLLAGHVGGALRNAGAHTAVVQQREHEQAVVDGMPDGVAVVSANGLVGSWNASAARLTGLSADMVIGQALPLPVPDLGVDAPLGHRGADGRPLEITSSPLPGGEVVVIIRDVSHAKALDDAKDMFIATTSHELRSPLTVVKGFASTLQTHWTRMDDDMREESLAAMVERTDGLIALVEALMLTVTVGMTDHALAMEPLALEPALERAAAQVPLLSAGHTSAVRVGADVPPVWADPAALRHAVEQLVENAVKYSPGGGEVELSAAYDGGGAVVIEVADRGVGLPAGRERSLFDRFVQGEGGDRRPYGGVGLGLHIVQTLVQSMGGTVSARNRDGGGAVLQLTLLPAPVPRAAPDETVRSAADSAA